MSHIEVDIAACVFRPTHFIRKLVGGYSSRIKVPKAGDDPEVAHLQ